MIGPFIYIITMLPFNLRMDHTESARFFNFICFFGQMLVDYTQAFAIPRREGDQAMGANEVEGRARRKFERLTTDLPATLTVVGGDAAGGGVISLEGRVLNLSMDGASIETYRSQESEFLRGTQRVTVEIALPAHSEPLRFSGEAVWSTEIADPMKQMTTLRFGVKILKVSPRHSAWLASYIKKELEEASS